VKTVAEKLREEEQFRQKREGDYPTLNDLFRTGLLSVSDLTELMNWHVLTNAEVRAIIGMGVQE
jgi:hypothetical protein